jgi:triacylglycerol esterase/lipase EstA (alpha/beta hydrolase family)
VSLVLSLIVMAAVLAVIVVVAVTVLVVLPVVAAAASMPLAMMRHRMLTPQTQYDFAFWWGECVATWRVRWWALLPSNVDVRGLAGRSRVVLLVHGAGADGSSMRAFANDLRAHGHEVICPHHGRMLWGLATHGRRLRAVMRAVLDVSPGMTIDVVAHSMGGLVLRTALRDEPQLKQSLGTVVTIASPHHGTGLAAGIPIGLVRELSPSSLVLPTLPSLVSLASKVVSIGAPRDQVVFPLSTTQCGTHCVAPMHVGHVQTLTDPWVIALVRETLRSEVVTT